MNRKQFFFLLLALVVLGGVGIAMFWQNLSDYQASGQKIGAKLLPDIKVADVARIELRGAKSTATLVRKDTGWVVEERNGYPAEFKAISDLIIKLIDLKVVQSEAVSESLFPRVELVEPAKVDKGGEGAGTQIELKDAAGKTLANLVLGKKILKKDPGNPLPTAQDGVPAGRYVRILGGKDRVVVVPDPLASAEAQPGRWLDRSFAKIERVKTLTVTDEGGSWKIARDVEWGQWKFAAGSADLDASGAVAAVNALSNLSFNDVEVKAMPEDEGKPVSIVAETFDNLTYTIKATKRKTGDDYLVNVAVAGEPPRTRTAEKDEKAEEKERRDKDYVETLKRLDMRLAREKIQSQWSYVVEAKQIAPLLKSREEMVAQRKPPPDADPRKR